MSSPHDQSIGRNPYRRTALEDPDGLLGATSTSTGQVTHSGAGLTGVEGAPLAATERRLPREITVTLASQASGYSLTPWTVAGTKNGVAYSEFLTPGSVNGNEVMRTVECFDDPSAVVITRPAQPGTSGSYQIGVGAVGCNDGVFRGVIANSAGFVNLQGDDGKRQTLPIALNQQIIVAYKRIVPSGTTADVTVLQ